MPLLPPPQPVIYGAVYSGIPVFEMMCNGVALMRRRSDSFLNLTQILKVANVDKLKRIQVLEAISESLKAEKIQFGYGKYQGLWIPLQRAIKIASRFHAAAIIQPLVDFQPPQSGSSQQQQQPPASSTAGRPPAPFANQYRPPPLPSVQPQQYAPYPPPSRPYPPQQQQQRPPPAVAQYPVPPPPAAIPAVANAVTALKRKERESNVGRPKRGGRPAQAESSDDDFDDDDLDDEELEALPAIPTRLPGRTTKRARAAMDEFDDDAMNGIESSATIPLGLATNRLSPTRLSIERQRQILMSIFTGPDSASVPDFLLSKQPEDHIEPDLLIDDVGHTALHWAATLAKLPVMAALISSKTCTATAVNSNGETALVRAVLSANNSDSQTYKSLLKLLGVPVLKLRDHKQRTVLHHVVLGFGVKGYSAAARYYLECLMEFVAKNKATDSELKDFVDAQDVNGDTALNIAARLGGRVAVELLIEGGASIELANSAGLMPADFGMDDVWKTKSLALAESVVPTAVKTETNSSASALPIGVMDAESDVLLKKALSLSQDLQNMIQSLTSTFAQEVNAKETHLTTKRKLVSTLTTELSELTRVNQILKSQNSRLPDLAAKLQSVELGLKEEVERKAEMARREMEAELNNVPKDSTILTSNGDSSMSLNNGSGGVPSISVPPITSTEDNAATYLRQKINILKMHVSKKQAENKKLISEIEQIKIADQVHELNYKRIIGMCCNLELDQIDAAMLGVLLAAVESDDNGIGSLVAGAGGTVGGGGGSGAGGVDEDPLAGLLESEPKDGALDGLLFKATSLSSI
ncbi:UNVERIFIED_CONTAM: transcriptional regulator swi6 [Siphonaria sp. JEL0065]|nr:transcriptional regulator swi6 [Siphonaria sp. JEL0065]